MRGYPLAFASVICSSSLACGSDTDTSGTTSATTASGPTDSSGSAGFPVTTGGKESESSTTMSEPTTESETDSSTSDSDDPCSLCEELEVCYCPCDAGDFCCECVNVPCVDNRQCNDGEQCASYDGNLRTCAPETCPAYLAEHLATDTAQLGEVAGVSCLASLSAQADVNDLSPLSELVYVDQKFEIQGAAVTNLAGLEKLEEVDLLILDGNQELSDISGLNGLKNVIDIEIRNNPLLPTAEVEALLAGIEIGGGVVVCGNLDEPPC